MCRRLRWRKFPKEQVISHLKHLTVFVYLLTAHFLNVVWYCWTHYLQTLSVFFSGISQRICFSVALSDLGRSGNHRVGAEKFITDFFEEECYSECLFEKEMRLGFRSFSS